MKPIKISYSINGKTCDDTASQNKAKLVITLIFCFIGSIFAIIGMCIYGSVPSANDYTKNLEAEFIYNDVIMKTSSYSTKSKTGRRKTNSTKYTPTYIGTIGEQSYHYEYHTEFSTQDKAIEFANSNQKLMVTSYLDSDKNQFLLASDSTINEYFNKEKVFSLIFVGVGSLFFIIGVIVACIPIGKEEIS